jgi:lipid II:glycine glycyltransferase (peptidoglycan interpeptide bridge formation enzyme)
LFPSFHKNCIQRKIRRAEREKLHYEEGTSEALLQKFYELLIMTRRRQCLPAQPLSWFRRLILSFGEDLKIRIATKDDLPIASILTLTHKKSMVYKYGCSDARFHRFGGVAFLLWRAIQEAKNKGCEEFEMGRSDSANLGLISFKRRWGTVGTQMSYWTYPHRRAVNVSGRQKAIFCRLVQHLPTFALIAAGKLLYRHIG